MSHPLDFTGIPAWLEIPGWFSLDKAVALQQTIKRLRPGAIVVELGSFCGRSSVALAAVLPPDGRLWCVDHFQGSQEHQGLAWNPQQLEAILRSNLAAFGVAEQTTVLVADTLTGAAQFQAGSIDLLLVDAAHDHDSVLRDLRTWYPLLRSGGWLYCDDYDPIHWPGVVSAIEAFRLPGRLAATHLWCHVKP